MSDPYLPLSDPETFGALPLPAQIDLVRGHVERELLDAVQCPDPRELFDLLNITRGELTCSTKDYVKWCAVIELAYAHGIVAGKIIGAGFKIGGAR